MQKQNEEAALWYNLERDLTLHRELGAPWGPAACTRTGRSTEGGLPNAVPLTAGWTPEGKKEWLAGNEGVRPDTALGTKLLGQRT